jgi:hypothetical protein
MDGRLNIASPPRPSDPNRVWLLGQIHDAILGLRRPGDDDAMRRVKAIMETPVLTVANVHVAGRPFFTTATGTPATTHGAQRKHRKATERRNGSKGYPSAASTSRALQRPAEVGD